MTAEATLLAERHEIQKTAAAAIAAGEVHQLADGRASVYVGLKAAAAGDLTAWVTTGQFTFAKTTSMVLLDGGEAYWDHSANKVHFAQRNDRDFFLGTVVGDCASGDTTCVVNLNVRPNYVIDLRKGVWTTEATNGLGTTLLPGGGAQLAFDAVAEAAQAALYSQRSVPIASNPILRARVAVFDKGDNAALDLDIGLASGSHATDFESVAEFCTIHFDGNALDIKAQSDDGTTDVAATDTTVDAVDDTYFEIWIDARDPSDIQVYVDGVLVLGATVFTWAAATGPVYAIALMEKTADDTTADFRIEDLQVRIAEQ